MSDKPERVTADDLIDTLLTDEAFLQRHRAQQQQRRENRQRYDDASVGLFADLAKANIPVKSLAELRRGRYGGPTVLAILVDWLRRVTYRPLKRDIIATLGSRWARPLAAGPLVEEFRRIDPSDDSGDASLRWAISDALERVADESILDGVVEIATSREHGVHRGPAVVALGNMGKARDRVVPLLIDLLQDRDVAGYAVMGLGKLKASEALYAIEPFAKHPEGWVRREAKKAIGRMR
jgi:HEAT repeat protein